jgi:hypothetical protein|tara:strand:- start:443 stop:988 length:546 start_codon:yes stop_codon:yes gene_type:complete
MKKFKKKTTIVVNTYEQLVKELKLHKISAQEAFNLAYKNKYQFNSRYYWTMTRIALYLVTRLVEHARLTGSILKSEKYKKIKFSNISSEEKVRIDKEVQKKMPKKINSCRKTVDGDEFKKQFKHFNPNIKYDARKEAQNLHKLVTEKRHNKKFLKREWDTSENKPMQTHSLLGQKAIDKIR